MLMTAHELFRLPDDSIRKHSELVRGVLCVQEPSGLDSSAVAVRITILLGSYVMAHGLGILSGEAGGYVLFRNPDTVRAPDVSFIQRDRLPPSGSIPEFFDGAPDLAIEVISPSNRRRALREKVTEYLAAGTRLVWVFDMWAKTAAVYRPGAPVQIVPDGGLLSGEDVVPGFELDISAVWPAPL